MAEDRKSEHVIQGIVSVEEEAAALRAAAMREREARQGAARSFEDLSRRLLAEVALLGENARTLAADPKANERARAVMEGKAKGVELAVHVVKDLADANLVALRQADGAVEGYTRLLQRTEQKKAGELRKAEQRAREAERDPVGTREDGSPAPVGRGGDSACVQVEGSGDAADAR